MPVDEGASDMDDITLWPTYRQAAAIAKGELASRELLDAQLARIEATNPALNAVVSLDAERARAAAAAADDAVARGESIGPLHGVPVTLKDAYDVAGWTSTGGSTQRSGHVPDRDAPAVAALRQAGIVLLGRTNVPEWSGDVQTYNDVFGVTNNPWDTSRTPGGSSGGAGVAVATGMSSFELGTDIGGSVRIPAAFNGVCGHKPSWGVVSTAGYIDYAPGSQVPRAVNVFGPLARTVDDLESVLDVVAGPHPRHARAWRLELPPARATTADGIRFAAWFDEPSCPTGTAVRSVLEAASDALAGAGAHLVNDRPELDWQEAALTALSTVMGQVSLGGDPDDPNSFADMRHRDWLIAEEARAGHIAAWSRYFADVDVLLAPVCVTAAFPHDNARGMTERTLSIDGVDRPYLDSIMWTTLIGGGELPSTVVPVGRTPDGLPVGIQVIGGPFEDRTTLAVARVLEGLLGGYAPPPSTLTA
jgi:amidase